MRGGHGCKMFVGLVFGPGMVVNCLWGVGIVGKRLWMVFGPEIFHKTSLLFVPHTSIRKRPRSLDISFRFEFF